jgi:tRNA pseudouridine13 synthase
MKLKVKPEDFIVKEVSNISLEKSGGAYKVFMLKKKDWDTLDLIGFISRKLGIDAKDIFIGGMKDRHGDTEQLISIASGRRLPDSLVEANFSLTALGYSNEKLSSKALVGNSFDITIRALAPREAALTESRIEGLRSFGIPNYFDEQRFGSARHGKGFMGKEIFLGDMEKALSLFLEPSKHDRKDERTFKRFVKDNWCKWDKCAEIAPPKYANLIRYLASRGNRRAFTGAFEHIDRRFVLLSLHGYQSYLWNRMLAKLVFESGTSDGFKVTEYPFKYGNLAFYVSPGKEAIDKLLASRLEIPGYDTVFDDPLLMRIAGEILEEERIGLKDLKVRKLYHMRVKGTERATVVIPENLSVLDASEDELYPGKRKLRLGFFLARGSYATLVIKRLFLTEVSE